MNESPFATHRAILVDCDYSAAGFLQSFAMAMYAGAAFPMDANGLRNLDDKHMKIFRTWRLPTVAMERAIPILWTYARQSRRSVPLTLCASRPTWTRSVHAT